MYKYFTSVVEQAQQKCLRENMDSPVIKLSNGEKLFPFGVRDIYVVANVFMETPLVHIRRYWRPEADTDSLESSDGEDFSKKKIIWLKA